MERSDGRLATVSYLFGAPEAPAEQPTVDETPAERAPDLAALPDLAAPAADGRTAASGWYLEPGAVDESEPDEVSEPEVETEAPALAEARRFLSAVKKDAPAATSGVRFVEEPDTLERTDPAEAKPPVVRKASINALARKGMSSAEMTTLLENREIDPDEVAAEVERLEAAGLLDDRVLADDLVRTLRDRKGLGKSAITAELRRRQVDQAAIDEALESVDVDDELERATEVAIKRAGQLSSYDRTTAERRLSAFLQRRGYSGTVVGAAVKAALGPAGPRFR
ncbi:SOS response regulatory protein OraA/RecX [Conyzicola lurida]|uniref:Regulatory protein RecX n=1 Tax=Conyzicola lurida TaxID=1172621 RepID=A0A841AMF4_9MICO|nr:SOS response regulatory protein OraA/RecX [Conyzicola lurida]